jgi:hypothetical protein
MITQTRSILSQPTRVMQSEANRRLAIRVAQKAAKHGATVALFSGTYAGLVGGHRVSDDVDFWVPNKHVDVICEAFPSRVFRGSDRTIITVNDDYGKLELMGDMVIHTVDEYGHKGAFPFHMSRQAQRRTVPGTIDGWSVRYADPVDTILLKAILQRGADQDKHDLRDIAAIVDNVAIDQRYLRLRIRETQSMERVGALLEEMHVLRPLRRLNFGGFAGGFHGLRESLVR